MAYSAVLSSRRWHRKPIAQTSPLWIFWCRPRKYTALAGCPCCPCWNSRLGWGDSYLLDFFMGGHISIHVSLLLEPGADGLQGSVRTAPAIVVHVVLHVVVVAVHTLYQVWLTRKTKICNYPGELGVYMANSICIMPISEGLKWHISLTLIQVIFKCLELNVSERCSMVHN